MSLELQKQKYNFILKLVEYLKYGLHYIQSRNIILFCISHVILI